MMSLYNTQICHYILRDITDSTDHLIWVISLDSTQEINNGVEFLKVPRTVYMKSNECKNFVLNYEVGALADP